MDAFWRHSLRRSSLLGRCNRGSMFEIAWLILGCRRYLEPPRSRFSCSECKCLYFDCSNRCWECSWFSWNLNSDEQLAWDLEILQQFHFPWQGVMTEIGYRNKLPNTMFWYLDNRSLFLWCTHGAKTSCCSSKVQQLILASCSKHGIGSARRIPECWWYPKGVYQFASSGCSLRLYTSSDIAWTTILFAGPVFGSKHWSTLNYWLDSVISYNLWSLEFVCRQ